MNAVIKHSPARLDTRRGTVDMTHGSGGRAMAQLIDMLSSLAAGEQRGSPQKGDINTLGAYGLQLLEDLTDVARQLNQPTLASEIERLSLPLALRVTGSGRSRMYAHGGFQLDILLDAERTTEGETEDFTDGFEKFGVATSFAVGSLIAEWVLHSTPPISMEGWGRIIRNVVMSPYWGGMMPAVGRCRA